MTRQMLIVGNWKMNGVIQDAIKWVTELQKQLGSDLAVEIVVAPPFTVLYSAQVLLQETSIKLAGQNMHWEPFGAYTGEVAAPFLKEAGCQYVILGHSERRHYFGETDESVNKKIFAALAAEIVPIFCIGETPEERKAGRTETVLEGQIKKGLAGLQLNDLEQLVIAYEPIWAIGTGVTATEAQIDQTHSFIRNYLEKKYDAPSAHAIRLLYGGSVTDQNARTILKIKNVDGLLVGGASLDPVKFANIVRWGSKGES